jgi:hypothetical protein
MTEETNTVVSIDSKDPTTNPGRLFECRPEEEYVVMIPERARGSIRVVHVFSHITPKEWIALDRSNVLIMRQISDDLNELESGAFEQAIALYDLHIQRVELWIPEDAGWVASGKEMPEENVSSLEKFKTINALTRVEKSEYARIFSADGFLASAGSSEIWLRAIQNDHWVLLGHQFRKRTTAEEKRFKTMTSRIQSVRGARKNTSRFPSDLAGEVELYDEVFEASSGYVDQGVPITSPAEIPPYHKRLALRELCQGDSVDAGEE